MTIIIMMKVKTIPVLVLTPVQTMKKGEEEEEDEEEEEEEERKEMIEEIIGELIEIDQTEIIIEINFFFI
jgi:hypothetical protein